MRETYRDEAGSKIGMWLFLLSEIALFGGLFILYSVYRYRNSIDFHLAAGELNRSFGALNTCVLITSSLTMALSISFLRKGDQRLSQVYLFLTLLFGLLFLGTKYFEWSGKIHHGIYPSSPRLLERSKGEVLFYGLYYSMTGLHGLTVHTAGNSRTDCTYSLAWAFFLPCSSS